MFQTNLQFPRLQQWQSRLSRIPRWAWITLGIGVVLPLVVLGISILAVVVISAFILLGAVGLVLFIRHRIQRLFHPVKTGGHANQIIVQSYKVIDP